MTGRSSGSLPVVMALVVAVTSLASAQDVAPDWDADRDGLVDRQEWRSGWAETGVFDRADLDRNGFLDDQEFSAMIVKEIVKPATPDDGQPSFLDRFGADAYEGFDTDGNGSISASELEAGIFDGYDRDSNDLLGPEEFASYTQDRKMGGIWSNEI